MTGRVPIRSALSVVVVPGDPNGGAHMMPGTRQPPSYAEPFSPRNGTVPASGQASCHAPLSAVMMTMVSGASARMTSMTRPMLQQE
jgi:hypothetical protein